MDLNLGSLRAGCRPCSTFGLETLHPGGMQRGWSVFFTASTFKL